ncbi:MAG: hypothetical protein ACLPY5_02680 [Candidatus Bathyarchaeia archaeon]
MAISTFLDNLPRRSVTYDCTLDALVRCFDLDSVDAVAKVKVGLEAYATLDKFVSRRIRIGSTQDCLNMTRIRLLQQEEIA